MHDVTPEHLVQALTLIQRSPRQLWPGFVPATIPALVFDGDATWLIGASPEEPGWEEAPHGWRWLGRYPALVANTAVSLPGGIRAAGVLLPSLGSVSAQRLASILVHEAFHVWQAANPSPAWEANELDALTYPAGNAEVLHARAAETACLNAALNRPDWEGDAAQALTWRAVRYAILSNEHQQYERRTETKEGLAQFVESRFLDALPQLDPLAAVGMGVRQWAYLSGAAYDTLLSRGADGWQAEVRRGRPLDELLAGQTGVAGLCSATTPALQDAAAHAAQAHTLRLEGLKQEFDLLPGKRVRLSGPALRVVGFDPLNVHALPGGQFLHTRYLRMQAGSGKVEIMGAQTLAGGADLLAPIALTIASVPEPSVNGGRWRIEHEQLRADFPARSVRETANGWEISLN